MIKVLIGIQCRMNSERLPGKALMRVGDRTIIGHVVKACIDASKFITFQRQFNADCRAFLLVPRGDDELIDYMKGIIEIIPGPENDVLTRYVKAANSFEADYVVRITGDCLYIPPHCISRHVKYALKVNSDYCNNVLERVSPEGWDTEVLSRRMLNWLDQHASSSKHREHVTSLIPTMLNNSEMIDRFSIHNSTEHLDLSHIKTSIDTVEDYDRACIEFETRKLKNNESEKYAQVF